MIAPRWQWVLLVAVAAAVVGAVRWEAATATHVREAVASARRANLDARGLQLENRRLAAEQPAPGEIARLLAEHDEIAALQRRLAELRRRVPDAAEDPEHAPKPISEWSYAGRSTPRAALESALWCASRGDVDRLAELLAFGPESTDAATALFAQLPEAARREFGGPQRVIATIVAADFPKNASAMAIEAETDVGGAVDLAVKVAREDGQERRNHYELTKTDSGWQLMVPASVLASCADQIKGAEPLAETHP